MKNIYLLVFLLFSIITNCYGIKYIIESDKSSISFKIKHLKKFTVNGEFINFSGTATINDDNKLNNVYGEIESSSINTNNKTRDRHLKSKDFLESKTYPIIEFNSSELETKPNTIDGVLSLHGVTQNISIPYSITPTNNNKLLITSTFILNRFDFGIKKHKRMVGKEVSVYLNFLLNPINN